jgi:RNA polymerase sigma factor (sigma-70 family)
VSPQSTIEGLVRDVAPQALGVVARHYGHFADAEDAVQEALLAAASAWRTDGVPDNPMGWIVRVASRRMADRFRAEDARRRRELLAASWSVTPPEASSGQDDTLILMLMCCHPSLTPAAAIPLTLRAVGGLTTKEIAAAFLVPEATMAQRISRAKAKIKASGESFRLPPPDERTGRVRSVLHVLYLLFNEGYATSSGPDLARSDLSGEAIRLARAAHARLADDPEVAGLLALMLLTEARRPARTGTDGELVPLAEQDRALWDRALVSEGLALIDEAVRRGQVGEYQIQASIAALHDQSDTHAETNWAEIASLYGLLERITDNPMVTLNRAVAVAMADGARPGLALLHGLDDRLGDHHRLHAVRAHLLEMEGEIDRAVDEFRAAAARATNLREQHYLMTKAARLVTDGAARPGGPRAESGGVPSKPLPLPESGSACRVEGTR